MLNCNLKRVEPKKYFYILNIAIAVQINKEFMPSLFSLIRLGICSLNTCRFNCLVWKQLNYRRDKNV